MTAPSDLSAFFSAMRRGLDGRLDAADVVEQCGGGSRVDRLDLVLRMVWAARRNLLRNAFAATAVAADALGEPCFDAAVDAHLAAEAGAERDFPRIALGFSETVAANARDPRVAEVADWEECLHRLSVVGAPPAVGDVVPCFVRQYTFDVPTFTAAARRDPDAPLPGAAATFALLHRMPDASAVRRFQPSIAHLAALAVARGELSEDAAPVVPAALAAAREDLIARGVLTTQEVA